MVEDTQSQCFQVNLTQANFVVNCDSFQCSILGGGIGLELMNYVKEIFRYAGVPVDFEIIDIDPSSEDNDDLEYAITSIKRNGVAIKGNIETKSESAGIISRNVALRNELDLFVNVMNIKSYPSVRSHYQDVDLVIIRQNTEGMRDITMLL